MKIQSINTTNNVYQKRPAFGMARISPTILKQIESKEKLTKNLDIVGAAKGLIYSVPAAIAANIIVNNKMDDNTFIEENAKYIRPLDEKAIKKLTNKELAAFLKGQDEEGKTLLHKELKWDLPHYMETKLKPKTIAEIYSIKDKDEKTAFMAQPNSSMLENSIYRVATQGGLSLEDSINLLKTNEMNPRVIEFLEYRADKKEGIVNSIIPTGFLIQLRHSSKDDTLNITADSSYSYNNEKYEGLKPETVAKLFISKSVDYPLELDRKYLPKAHEALLANLTQIALHDYTASTALCSLMCKDKALTNRIKGIVPSLNFFGVERKNIDKIGSDIISVADNLRAYKETDKNGRTPLHLAAARMNSTDFDNHLDYMVENFKEEDIIEILSMRDCDGDIPMAGSADALTIVCNHFSDKPEILINMLKNQDKYGNTPLHDWTEEEPIATVLNVLGKNEEALADILSIKNNEGKTIYTISDDERPYDYDAARMLRKKIIELATNSDLSLEKSYTLLANNNLEPAIQEFLKLQIEQRGKQ